MVLRHANGSVRAAVSNTGDVVVDTGTVIRDHRSESTQRVKKPKGRTASEAEVATDDRPGDPAIGWVILVVSLIAGWAYYLANRNSASPSSARRSSSPRIAGLLLRRDVGGPAPERVQLIGVLMLLTMVIGLPLYWVPSRPSAGAASSKEETFIEWGRECVRDNGQRRVQLRLAATVA